MAQALKANEDLAVTSLNLANNFFTKFGQVSVAVPVGYSWCHLSYVLFMLVESIQVALSEAREHVYEMSEKEIDIFF